ncbi:MAG: adenine deaminase [Candidatus Kapabacteria bacterium]|nr:adenine deaminase [Candidatus Kapabacteria bacterium]
MPQQKISGKIVDVVKKEIFDGIITIENGRISSVDRIDLSFLRMQESTIGPWKEIPACAGMTEQKEIPACAGMTEKDGIPACAGMTDTIEFNHFILPGLIDAHIHIESSMLVPSEFARLAVRHGTVATVSDPHEIANVLGREGIDFMLQNAESVPMKFYFGAPSCVPATNFESSGAEITVNDISELLDDVRIKYLSEMMNFPGVIHNFPDVVEKLNAAKLKNKPIDGHAPGLTGDDLKKYIEAGISTDHECFTIEEAEAKIALGMKILIREGSAAKNFDALKSLIKSNNEMVMLCSDDCHPDDLATGHINLLVKRALDDGFDIFDILRTCTLNPKNHYGLETGLLQIGDSADFIVVDNFQEFNILQTYIDGNLVAENGKETFRRVPISPVNRFHAKKIEVEDLFVAPPLNPPLKNGENEENPLNPTLEKGENEENHLSPFEKGGNLEEFENPLTSFKIEGHLEAPFFKGGLGVSGSIPQIRVIEALEGELITNELICDAKIENNCIVSDLGRDILKLVVLNRYQAVKNNSAKPAIAFIKNFGFTHGAIASSVAHDSHNIIAVGADDDSIVRAINLIIENQGGMCAVGDDIETVLPLPVAGIMSCDDAEHVSALYSALNQKAKALGSALNAPFMTLSFMALLVIPKLKLSDKGLFDGGSFRFVDLFN